MVVGNGGNPYGMGSYYLMPYVVPETSVEIPVVTLQIPPGELAVHRGTHVRGTDGEAGKVDEQEKS